MKHIFSLFTLFCLPMLLHAQAQQATLLGRWDDPTIVGSQAYNNRYNEVWSFAVNGHEYAVIGSTMGTHIIDVTNPTQPFQRTFVPGKTQGPSVIHRDYKTYKNYLYGVCDEGQNSSLQIMDFSKLPDTLKLVSNSSSLLVTGHNIFIDSTSALMYVLVYNGGAQYGFGGMGILSLANPEVPVYVKKYNNIQAFSFGHIHDAYVRNDTAYLDAGNDGFAVADFKNPLQPKLLGTMTAYQGQGYNHSGWLSDDGRYYYMADETHGSPVKTVDVQSFEDIKVVETFNAASTNNQIPHNQMIACNYLYVSYYYDGLQVFDISDPLNVERVLYYDTSTEPNNGSYKGAWGVNPFLPSGNILISDMQNGLFVFQGIGDGCTSPTSKTKDILKQNMSMQITPQPAHDKLMVKLEGETKGVATFFDLNMKQIFKQDIDSQNFELKIPTSLANGIYFLKVQTNEKIGVKKVLIQR